jgi:hypothetical protein
VPQNADMASDATQEEASLERAKEPPQQKTSRRSTATSAGIQVSRHRLAHAREMIEAYRSELYELAGLDDAERVEAATACVFALLRFANIGRLARTTLRVASDAFIVIIYAGVVLTETIVAYTVLHPHMAAWSLVLDVWSGAVASWLLASVAVFGFGRIIRLLLRRRLPTGIPALAWNWIGLGLLGLVVVGDRLVGALAEPTRQASYGLLAILFGFMGGLTRPRILTLSYGFLRWIFTASNPRFRPRDRLLITLVIIAGEASAALGDRGAKSWRDPARRREVARLVQDGAREVELAPRLLHATRWWEFGLRADVAAPYLAVASVVRGHRIKVLAAQSEEEWSAVCASLASGVLAAARQDWAELTRAAPSVAPRWPILRNTLRRLAGPVTLIAGAVLLPIAFPLGAYATSLRSILTVSAVLALLPGQSENAGIIRDAMTRTQGWHQ